LGENEKEIMKQWEKEEIDESKMLLKKDQASLNIDRVLFQDPKVMSQGKTAGNEDCAKCCGSVAMCFCCPCHLVCGGNSITINQGQAGILTSFGKYEKTLPPGFYRIDSCVYQVKVVTTKL
jgi:hypothetical protein